MTDLHWLTVAEAGDLIRRKQLSPVEYAEALFARVDRYNPAHDPFILQLRDHAMARARHAQEEIDACDWRWPFPGVPSGPTDTATMEGPPTPPHTPTLTTTVAPTAAPPPRTPCARTA